MNFRVTITLLINEKLLTETIGEVYPDFVEYYHTVAT